MFTLGAPLKALTVIGTVKVPKAQLVVMVPAVAAGGKQSKKFNFT